MKELQTKYDVPHFLGELIFWCYRWGCEVQLRNMHWKYPIQDPKSPWFVNERFERQVDGSLADLSRYFKNYDYHIPEIIFTKDDKHVSVSAEDFPMLMDRLKHDYRRIFMELSVPNFNPFKESK